MKALHRTREEFKATVPVASKLSRARCLLVGKSSSFPPVQELDRIGFRLFGFNINNPTQIQHTIHTKRLSCVMMQLAVHAAGTGSYCLRDESMIVKEDTVRNRYYRRNENYLR